MSESAGVRAANGFDIALSGAPASLRTSEGRTVELAVRRWHQVATGSDLWMLDRCVGPTLDVGCGPGRLVACLLERGVPALGVDSSPLAGVACGDRTAVLNGDVFDTVPGEGRWAHVLLADGNVGIGGDPAALLARCRELLAPGGTVLVELEGPGTGWWTGFACLEPTRAPVTTGTRPRFRWAFVGLDALDDLAAAAGLHVVERHQGRRCFAQLSQVINGHPVDVE